MNDRLIKKVLSETKTVAMVGVSYIDESKETSNNIIFDGLSSSLLLRQIYLLE